MLNDQNAPPNEDLLDRYLAGSLNTNERQHVDAYCLRYPRYAEALKILQASATRADLRPSLSAAETLPLLRDRMDIDSNTLRPTVVRNRGQSQWYLFGTLAALALAAIGIIGRPNQHTQDISSSIYQTRTGQRATVPLVDGTEVVMGPQTSLKLANPVGATSRQYALVGQAQFDVVANNSAPFTVTAGQTTTRVLGTRFIIEHYTNDDVTRVQVIQGRVDTRARDRSTLLNAGMTGVFTDSTSVATESHPKIDVASWVNGQLEFVDVPVPQMLATLTRWYGYEFKLDDTTLAKRHVTATFDVRNRTETMVLLKELLGVSMTFNGKTVVLRPVPRVRSTPIPPLRPEGTMASAATEVLR